MECIRYTLEMDDEGRRYWLCDLNGESSPLPPEFTLQFRADVYEIEGHGMCSLPLKTTVTFERPGPSEAVDFERKAYLRVLKSSVRRESEKHGEKLSDEEAEELVKKTLAGLMDEGPDVRRVERSPPLIVPGNLSMVDQLARSKLIGPPIK